MGGRSHATHLADFDFDQDKDINIATLALLVGGPKLVYTLSKALDLPSLSTIYKHSHRPQINPCLSFPEVDEIVYNIEAHFSSKAASSVCGYSLLVDDISLEERLQYHYQTDSVIELCCEHSGQYDLKVSSLSTVEAIGIGLQEKTLHRAKDCTVVAIAAYGHKDYGPATIMLSRTCKAETTSGQARWLEGGVKAWQAATHGEAVFGPLWTIASDGDATRCRAMHGLFLRCDLIQGSPLHKILAPLPLFNLQVSDNDETLDFNPKHIVKRFGTLERGQDGILVYDTHVTPIQVRKELYKLPNADTTNIQTLFNGRDAQNVPKAVRLLSMVSCVQELHPNEADPIQWAIILWGDLTDSYLHPFIDPHMTLSEQLTSLATTAHLLLVLYRKSGTSLMPGQLYYDTQSDIKSAFFCVAKQQLLNPEGEFFLLQLGTDRLEGQFGDIRTIGSTPNVDISRLADRTSAAGHMSHIYQRHPHWHWGHRRLTLTGKEGVDHTNP